MLPAPPHLHVVIIEVTEDVNDNGYETYEISSKRALTLNTYTINGVVSFGVSFYHDAYNEILCTQANKDYINNYGRTRFFIWDMPLDNSFHFDVDSPAALMQANIPNNLKERIKIYL